MTKTPAPPAPPKGLKAGGRALWRAVQSEYELEQHERGLLLEMCRTVDQLNALNTIIDREGVMQPGVDRVHPALLEARQLRIAYARMSAALRLPAGLDGDADRRPQRRTGVRGVYGITGAVS